MISFISFFKFLVSVYEYLCNTLLPNDGVQAIPADFGKIMNPTPVNDNVIEVEVAAKKIILSTDSNTVFRVLYFLYIFLIYGFCL